MFSGSVAPRLFHTLLQGLSKVYPGLIQGLSRVAPMFLQGCSSFPEPPDRALNGPSAPQRTHAAPAALLATACGLPAQPLPSQRARPPGRRFHGVNVTRLHVTVRRACVCGRDGRAGAPSNEVARAWARVRCCEAVWARARARGERRAAGSTRPLSDSFFGGKREAVSGRGYATAL